MVTMGSKVVDTVSGFTGMVTAICEYIIGPTVMQVESLYEGRRVIEWFDQDRLTEKE